MSAVAYQETKERRAEATGVKPASGCIDRPIFVIGTGRCGLSLIVDLIGAHEDVGWFSQWTRRFPASKLAPRLPYICRKPVIKQLVDLASFITRKHLQPRPHETFIPFRRSFLGFAEPYRPLTALDVDGNARKGIYGTVLAHVEGQHKKRFVMELSGWARIVFLRTIFPDAQFIHVVRDARATVNSLLNVEWWDGWFGESWRYGPIPEKYRHFLNSGTPSFAAMAGILWNLLIDNTLEEAKTVDSSSFMEVRFEDVVRDTEGSVKRFCAFAGLPLTETYDRAWRSVRVYNPNESRVRIAPWRENLTEAQQQVVANVCAEHLRRYAYIGGSR